MAGTLNLDAAVNAAATEDASLNASTPPSTTPSTEAGVSAPSANPGTPVGDGGAAGAVANAGGAPAPASWTLRSQLAELGLDANQFPDDQAAWAHVRQQLAIRSQEFERQRQIMAWQQQQLQALNQQRQAPATPAAPQQQQGWWNPPPYDAAWEKPFMVDKEGKAVTPADVDNGIAMQLNNYRAWQREQFNNLLRDPIKTLQPGLEQFIGPVVQQAIQQHLGQYQDRQFANQWVQSQQDQLFMKDAQGNRLMDGFNNPVLTPTGQRFVQHIQMLDQAGIKSPQLQQQLASALIQREALLASQQQPAAGGVPPTQSLPAFETNEQKAERVRREAVSRGAGASRLPSSGGAPPVSATTPNGGNRGIDVRLGLGQKLRDAMTAGGVAVN